MALTRGKIVVAKSQTDVIEAPTPAGVPVRRANAARSKRAKSEITRARLCNAASRLIEQKSLRLITVSELTALAGVAPSTFYIYFADVDGAVLALLEDAQAAMPDLAATTSAISPERPEPGVRTLLTQYLAFWDQNYALLRIRNLAADEGEARFRDARGKMLGPLLFALAEKIAEIRGDELSKRTPALAIASVISGSMERLASFIRFRHASPDMSRKRLIEAQVFLICQILTRDSAR
jgi:AcrR family transcriptional regulator